MASAAAIGGKGSKGTLAGLGYRKVTPVDPRRHDSKELNKASSNARSDIPQKPLWYCMCLGGGILKHAGMEVCAHKHMQATSDCSCRYAADHLPTANSRPGY